MSTGLAIFLVGTLVTALWAFFWNERNTTTKKIEKVENDLVSLRDFVNKEIKGIYDEVKEINHKLDASSNLERPSKACTTYMANEMNKLTESIKDVVELQLRRFLEKK